MRAADEAVLNNVHKKIQKNPPLLNCAPILQIQVPAAKKHHRDPGAAEGAQAAEAETGGETLLQDGVGGDTAQEKEEENQTMISCLVTPVLPSFQRKYIFQMHPCAMFSSYYLLSSKGEPTFLSFFLTNDYSIYTRYVFSDI